MDNNQYIERLIDTKVDEYLSCFGAVCIEGPKWCGKSWTGMKHAKSVFWLADPKDNFANRQLASLDVMKALDGVAPHLIDEWQEIPAIWDAVRFAVDERSEEGRFLLTGSSTPPKKGVIHSGTGRIASLQMHPMSLYESGASSGMVSLQEICDGNTMDVLRGESPSLEQLISYVIRGGWPGSLRKTPNAAALIPRVYVENVIRNDIGRMDDSIRDQAKVRKCLRSLARNESTTASLATIRDDIDEVDDTSMSPNTVADYLNLFKRIFLTNDIESFSTFLRSPSRIKQSPKRHFCDPSIAAALLGATERMLLRDLRTFGFLFESLAIRDLQIYAETMGAKLYHYQDYDGNEMDAVIQFDNDRWSGFEIKLNPEQVDEAASKLLKIAKLFKHNPPESLAVVVGKSGLAYRRPDGVYVLPLTMLKP